MKLNEWKCDISIDDADVYIEPTGALKDMVEHFKLKYNPRTGIYDCDGNVDLWDYYESMDYAERDEFDNAFVRNGKMTIKLGTVKGDFILPGKINNKYAITSLEGCPESVGGKFDCGYNQLTSLEGCPKTVGGDFSCRNNQLTSLECCPESVCGNFYCDDNQLTSLEGCPKTVGGSFYCYANKRNFTKEYVCSVCDVKKEIYV